MYLALQNVPFEVNGWHNTETAQYFVFRDSNLYCFCPPAQDILSFLQVIAY